MAFVGGKELIAHRSKYFMQLHVLLEFSKQTDNPEAISLLREACQASAEYSAFALVHIDPYLERSFPAWKHRH